ncbi:hypothetical protein [Desulfuribacillus alkaliarsenatis]|uniref:Spore coat protein n=1 Tax=Desulfuribacillus alkaliarsenatis TaxID=766136 RepID=A0A1E5G619_9FIRM|nr:hypothetical protein [Desulfuribacillus alkaliarsenatis]OEF98214.1 hypothetical protein BHF68_00560 [Desulfuribacillus alkaliarsenatis]
MTQMMGQNQLSDKDLLYIQDELNTELLMVKKYHDAMQTVACPEIKQAFQQACEMHQRHYQTMLTQLQGTTQGQMQ